VRKGIDESFDPTTRVLDRHGPFMIREALIFFFSFFFSFFSFFLLFFFFCYFCFFLEKKKQN